MSAVMFRLSHSRLSVAALLALGLVGCEKQSLIDGEIIGKAVDPNSTVTALIARAGHGATVSWVYRVYMQPTQGGPVGELLRADKADGLSVSWEGRDALAIKMKCGRVFAFQNFFDVLNEDGKLRKRVMVRLDSNGLCPE
jgi:hypothetical protein